MKYLNHGTVQQGKFLPEDSNFFKKSFKQFEGKRITVSIGNFRKPRSLEENAYYWGVVIQMIAEYIGEDEHERIHEYLKSQFLTVIEYRKIPNSKEFIELKRVKSTTELSTIQMEDFLEKCRHWAAEFLSINIPLPNQAE